MIIDSLNKVDVFNDFVLDSVCFCLNESVSFSECFDIDPFFDSLFDDDLCVSDFRILIDFLSNCFFFYKNANSKTNRILVTDCLLFDFYLKILKKEIFKKNLDNDHILSRFYDFISEKVNYRSLYLSI